MYLKKLHLKNVGSFDELDLDFSSEVDVRRSVLILGDNGVGKTTILRSIALGLCDETGASGLLSEPQLQHFQRKQGDGESTIRLELWSPDDLTTVSITKRIAPTNSKAFDVKQSIEPKDFPLEKIFACGYGIARRPFGSENYKEYRLVDSVYTLVNYEASLWSLELPFYRLARGQKDIDDLLRRIEQILLLPKNSLILDTSGFSFDGPLGAHMPLELLGDGYTATFGWLADLMGWGMLFYRDSFNAEFKGIVLVDMIERDLHPSWQRTIIGHLRRQFPGIQFIMTTHAPMCAIGMTELRDDDCEIVLVREDGDHCVAVPGIRPPRGERADQVLTSALFGLVTSGDEDTKEAIERFARLGSTPRKPDEEIEFNQLKLKLERTVGTAETKLEQYVRDGVEEILSKTPAASDFPKDAIRYEVLRQIRDLLNS